MVRIQQKMSLLFIDQDQFVTETKKPRMMRGFSLKLTD